VLKFRYLPKLKAFSAASGKRSFIDWLSGAKAIKEIEITPYKAFTFETGQAKKEDFNFIQVKVPKRLINSGQSIHISY